VVYARHIQPPYIYMEYTWYILTINLIWVPDGRLGGQAALSLQKYAEHVKKYVK
jgi:hypothetical protein